MKISKRLIACFVLIYTLFSRVLFCSLMTQTILNYHESGMPCENPTQFQEWYKIYEQETKEKEIRKYNFWKSMEKTTSQKNNTLEDSFPEAFTYKTSLGKKRRSKPSEIFFFEKTLVRKIKQNEQETSEKAQVSYQDTAWINQVSEEKAAENEPPIQPYLYSVGEEILNPELQNYLNQQLTNQGIEWFMPYAIMIAWQESQFNQYEVSKDGLDYGLFQFRMEFWDWNRGDIFDPYVQIDVFTENMGRRANMGLDVYEMISRHMQSDYGSYNPEYVSDVIKHEPNLRKIEE